MDADVNDVAVENQQEQRLSYKFQRLRERLREAVASGELSGKLPGERQLARRFRVNAKTLSKALTDLAAEGLLERSIGRGTFVRDRSQPEAPVSEKWLVIADDDQRSHPVMTALLQQNPNLDVISPNGLMRPSFLSQFKVALVISQTLPDSMLRDLMVRNLSVLLVGREPGTYSTHAVLIDNVLATTLLVREMILSGHTRFAVVEPRGRNEICHAVRAAATRYGVKAEVDSVEASFAGEAIEQGATAVICAGDQLAREARRSIEKRGHAFPGRVALAAIGAAANDYPCSGYFVHPQQYAQTISQLIRDRLSHRPTALWLTGTFVDAGTMNLDALKGTIDASRAMLPQSPSATLS
jgi:DNA-binding transcriptional regulator YhcF (GntR family)